MKQYQDLVTHVLQTGTRKENRTGVDTLSTFGYYYEHDLRDGFPLLTTKSVSWKNIVVELLWFLSGSDKAEFLERHKCGFWKPWYLEDGRVANCYGPAWRKFPVHEKYLSSEYVHRGHNMGDMPICLSYYGEDLEDFKNLPTVAAGEPLLEGQKWCTRCDEALMAIFKTPDNEYKPSAPTFRENHQTRTAHNDQIRWVVDELKRNPMSRRMIVNAWAPGIAQTAKLPPCHAMFVLNVQNSQRVIGDQQLEDGSRGPITSKRTQQSLCLHLTQRSCDVALGVPYNLASYALLLSLFSRFSGIEPGIFGHSLIDAHIYTAKPDGSMAEYDHVPGLKEQGLREPLPLPKLIIDDSIKSLEDVEALLDPSVSTEALMAKFKLEGYQSHPEIKFKVAV